MIFGILPSLDDIYKNSVPIYFEYERNPQKSTNVVGFHNYLSKVRNANGDEYYVRISTQELTPERTNKKGEGIKQFHNAAISDVQLYKISGQSVTPDVLPAGTTTATANFIDTKLADFFNSVNPSEVSKVVDENGEPLVVWHGGTFRKEYIPRKGMHFGTEDAAGSRIGSITDRARAFREIKK
jgi:hypothetical protein